MNLPANQSSLCIFDNFKAQLTAQVLELLKSNHGETVFVPPSCIDQLQPLDLSANKSAKDFYKKLKNGMLYRFTIKGLQYQSSFH